MKARLRFVAVVVLLTVPLVLLMQDLTRGALLAQIQEAIWWAGIVLDSLPQLPLWIAFVLLAFVLAVLTLLSFVQPPPQRQVVAPPREGRIVTLARQIERARREEYYRWEVARQIGQLVVQLLAHQRQTTLREIRQQLRADQVDLPPEIVAYLRTGLSPIYGLSGGLARRVRRLFKGSAGTSAHDEAAERVCRYVEEQLEVLHER